MGPKSSKLTKKRGFHDIPFYNILAGSWWLEDLPPSYIIFSSLGEQKLSTFKNLPINTLPFRNLPVRKPGGSEWRPCRQNPPIKQQQACRAQCNGEKAHPPSIASGRVTHIPECLVSWETEKVVF